MKEDFFTQFRQWYDVHADQILKDFCTFLSFPSISTEMQYAKQVRNTAEWLCAYMNGFGLETVLWETPGHPVIFGSHCHAGQERPTVLIYHHYDVQPVDPLELWTHDPFQPIVKGNQIFARGAVDNKGQCFYSLTALKALLSFSQTLNCNIKVFIEGEEEAESKGTHAILQHRKEELKADYLLVVDFDMVDSKTAGVTLGMRGLVTLNVECQNGASDLHSGVHGGIVLNPNRVLATLLASLWNDQGQVVVPHFYDSIQQLPKTSLASIDMSFNQEGYSKEFGVHAFAREEGYSLKESNWLRPTLEINGMWGGYIGGGFKTVIPATAHAKLSARLVPNQDPAQVGHWIAQYLKEKAPVGCVVNVDVGHGAPAYWTALDSPIVKTAAMAYEEILGTPCQYLFCGASVPIVIDLARVSGAEVAMLGVGLASDGIHAPNEHFGLDRFKIGYLAMGRILDLLHN